MGNKKVEKQRAENAKKGRVPIDLEHTQEIKRIPDLIKPINGLMNRKEGKRCFREVALDLNFYSVPFFLIQGTALGAYRDNGFVPTEKDIDFGMLHEDFVNCIHRICLLFVAKGYEIRTINRPFTKPRVINAIKGTVKIDVVSYHKHESVRYCPNTSMTYSIVQPAALMENTQPIELFGVDCKVPYPNRS
jgi:hypothetical protein